MEDLQTKKKRVADFLQTLTAPGRLSLTYKILETPTTRPDGTTPEIEVEFSGPDVPLLLARNGELLLSIEQIAAKILRYEHEEHDRISFDADNFKVLRQRELQVAAEVAIERVRRTGQPFSFAPMSSRERRLLHLALAASGLHTASSGEGSRRFVVLYPEGEKPPAEPSREDRAAVIRQRFRRR
ncbi:MAG TPA: R3H domain-containing nucleic acid-binding protein [Edaphobacter sp.]|nr:R3H domain-containing nucleic acid-binding protein [Edaphobacter sp.]